MGYGEVVGNESVHWTVVHEDEQGAPVSMARKQGAAASAHPKKAHHVHVDKGCKGCDPQALAEVGKRKGHTGRYRVRLRFERMTDAKEAAASLQHVMFEDGMYVLVLDVPVIHRHDPSDPPPAEIRIDW
jgi:hypothetical protein